MVALGLGSGVTVGGGLLVLLCLGGPGLRRVGSIEGLGDGLCSGSGSVGLLMPGAPHTPVTVVR